MLTVISVKTPKKINLRRAFACEVALVVMLAPSCAWSQTTAQTPGSTIRDQSTQAGNQRTKIPTVTTTIVVQGETAKGYLPEAVSVGNLDSASLQETPLSALAVTRTLMDAQQARLLSDVVKNDASIGENYAPVGYYGDYQIRGVPIDLATGIEVNGMKIAGEQDVPFENKQRVEFLNGIAGIESGVASAGGLVNYVTRRAAVIKAVDFATDQRGTAYGATDLGWLLGSQKQFGMRFNLAGERIMSYVNGADGWRAAGTAAFDWKLSSRAIWTNDFEYQHKVERSEGGYQLLGGLGVPDLNLISPAAMLGFQSWAKPNTFDVYNTGSRIEVELPKTWRLSIAGGFSHSLIDDNVVYAYGCSSLACNPDGSYPEWFFAPNGDFDIYDYRNPGELRIDAQAQALLVGHIRAGKISQDMSGGGELFLRSVHQPGYFTQENPSTEIVADGAVYTYIGTENIYEPDIAVPIETPHQSAGPRRLWEDHHDASAIVQDRIHLPAHFDAVVGGRLDSTRDHNYSLSATNPGTPPTLTDKTVWLPQYAAVWTPITSLTLYSNYAEMLSLGPQGPWWVDNANQFLAPFNTREVEVGGKFVPGDKLMVTAAVFHLRTPFFYPREIQAADSFCTENANTDGPVEPGDMCFEQDGRETHNGAEMNAQGKAARWLQLSGSATWMKAISSDSQTPNFNDKQIINQPIFRMALFSEFAMPRIKGFYLMPGWSYTGSKEATRDDRVSVPGYNIFNMGARYAPAGENGRLSLRLYADNILDKRYWKDTGANYGDTFLHLGAPTTVRLSLHYIF